MTLSLSLSAAVNTCDSHNPRVQAAELSLIEANQQLQQHIASVAAHGNCRRLRVHACSSRVVNTCFLELYFSTIRLILISSIQCYQSASPSFIASPNNAIHSGQNC